MIQVHYRPITGLKPLHLALLGVAEVAGGIADFEARLSLPRMMVEHAVDDLGFWQFAERHDSELHLSAKGTRALSVWVATNKKGYWQFADDGTWLLGKGKFSFRPPLAFLDDAGFNPETGDVLSESEAKESLQAFYRQRAEIEKRISDKIIIRQLDAALQKNGELCDVIGAELSKAVTILQSNQMNQMISIWLTEALAGKQDSGNRSADGTLRKCRQVMAKAKEEGARTIRDREVALQSTTRALLGGWLKRKDGLLQSIAVADPNSLLIVSECGDVLWTEERPNPGIGEEVTSSKQSFFSNLGTLIGSLFR